jgi:dihydroorotate dehydrogenase (NAD+) catalytic subunit
VNVTGGVAAPTEAFPAVRVGSVHLRNPVMTASGTAGYSDELSAYVDLSSLGAVVVKSLAPFAWQGNSAPRVHALEAGMINAVGLQGGGVAAWISDSLPRLVARRASVVASVWGFRPSDYAEAARMLAPVADQLVAVEVNLSCPNLDHARAMIAHDAMLSHEVITAVRAELPASLPVWAKMSPNTDRLVTIAETVLAAGAETLVLVNTVLGMAIDTMTRRPVLGNGGGGVSGAAIHAVAVRSVFDVRVALPHVPIVGVGGISHAHDAIELLMAGANAVQVGTATFADPRAVTKVMRGMQRWAQRHGVRSWEEVSGAAH